MRHPTSWEESPGAFTCSSGAVRAAPSFLGQLPVQGKSSRKMVSIRDGQRGPMRLEGPWGERRGVVFVCQAPRSSPRMHIEGY